MKKYFGILIANVAMIFCLVLAIETRAATFVVNTTNDTNDATAGDMNCADAGGMCSLRAAISEANALVGDDTITLPAGTYTNTLTGGTNDNTGGDLDILSNITVNGAGFGSTIIQANVAFNTATERVFHILNNTGGTTVTFSLNNVTVRNGRTAVGTFGAGVRAESNPSSALVNVTINNTAIRENVAQGRAGGLQLQGSGATLTVNNSLITGNRSEYNNTTNTNLTLGGAGVLVSGGTATFNNTNIFSNPTTQATTNAAPAAAFGGGATVVSNGTATFNFCQISNNLTTTATSATASGGGIAISAGTVNLNNSTLNVNSATTTGTGGGIVGGIDNQNGTLNIANSTISSNSAASSGGVRNIASTAAATTTISNSAIVNNSVTASIGGISNITTGVGNATLNINNSTIGGNSAFGSGGGVQTQANAAGNATVNIRFSTIAGNIADGNNNATGDGGGIANLGQTVTGQLGVSDVFLLSSVVADNDSLGLTTDDIFGVLTSQQYNHVENLTGGTFIPAVGDVVSIDPSLTVLAPNGGTLNYLPSAGSVLNDTIPNGTNQCGTAPFNADQRNVVRPFGTACEKGAAERGLVILTASNLPNGATTAGYSQTLTADFGTPPYTFSLLSGTLPPGLTLMGNGTISGTPTTAGGYSFMVQVTDSNPFGEFLQIAPNTSQKMFELRINSPTAASASVSGRIIAASGGGISRSRVSITDSHGVTRTASTGTFGYYRFDEVNTGASYVVSVTNKRYTFTPQVIFVSENIAELNFTAQ